MKTIKLHLITLVLGAFLFQIGTTQAQTTTIITTTTSDETSEEVSCSNKKDCKKECKKNCKESCKKECKNKDCEKSCSKNNSRGIVIDRENKNVELNLSLFNNDEDDNFRVALLDIGQSTLISSDGDLNLPSELSYLTQKYPGSWNINLHFFRHRINIIKKIVNIDYGFSVNFRQYKFEDDFELRIEDVVGSPNQSQVVPFDTGVEYKKNKLRTSHLELPIGLTLVSKKSNLHLTLGAYGSMRIGSNQKLKSDEFGRQKIKDDFNLRSFSHGFYARVGLGPIELYAQIPASSLFRDETSPEVYGMNFGIALLAF